jgi:hypothetical protein
MPSTTCLQSSSIDTLDRPILPSHFIASFSPLASASCGCGIPKNQAVFAFMNSPSLPLIHIPIPYQPWSLKIAASILHLISPAFGLLHRSWLWLVAPLKLLASASLRVAHSPICCHSNNVSRVIHTDIRGFVSIPSGDFTCPSASAWFIPEPHRTGRGVL